MIHLKTVAPNLDAVAQHIRENLAFEKGARPPMKKLPTRSTHEAYVLGYNEACEDIASLLEQVTLEEDG